MLIYGNKDGRLCAQCGGDDVGILDEHRLVRSDNVLRWSRYHYKRRRGDQVAEAPEGAGPPLVNDVPLRFE